MQSTLISDGNNGHDPNKIIVSQDLTVDRHNLKDLSPEPITAKIPESPATPDVQPAFDRQPTPKQKKPIALILAGVGIGAIAASVFGYRYWQFISTHQTTDNATVFGHIHQISSKMESDFFQGR